MVIVVFKPDNRRCNGLNEKNPAIPWKGNAGFFGFIYADRVFRSGRGI